MDENQKHAKREQFHKRLREKELLEGYSYDDGKDFVTRPYWPLEPKNKMKPHLWKWKEIRPLVQECGDMIGLGKGSSKYDRRVLALSNPGAGGEFTMSGPLFGDIQLIRPGEAAPCHRHTPAATRIILEGEGGWTTVGGDRVHVKPGDVVHTGQFPWHDHGNGGPDDFIFLDVLDIPLLFFTGTSAWEFENNFVNQPAEVIDFKNQNYVNASLRPSFKPSFTRDTSGFAHLAWRDAKGALIALEGEKGSLYDGLRMEMRNTDGGPVGRTMSVHTQWIRPGEQTLTHRHTGAFIYVCAEGSGSMTVEDQTFELSQSDILVLPSWHWHSLASAKGCVLHSVSDLSMISKMHLYREQRKTTEGKILDSGWTPDTEIFER